MKTDGMLFVSTSLLKKEISIKYFSGVAIEYGFLLVPAKGRPTLGVSSFEVARIKKLCRAHVVPLRTALFDEISKRTKRMKTIGIDSSSLSVMEWLMLKKKVKAKLINARKELLQRREIKSQQEILKIRKAAEIGDELFRLLLKFLQKKRTEREARMFLVSEMLARGCTEAFDTIIAAGAHSSYPHHVPTDSIIKGFCVIDFGVEHQGYCSDMTRTIYKGKPTMEEKEAYYSVLNVQRGVLRMITPGMLCKDADGFARKHLGKALIHSLGHGIGVEVHENPSLSPKSKSTFMKGQVFTIEPGVYYPGKYGIRIEDDVWIDQKGRARVLTKSPKDLIVL